MANKIEELGVELQWDFRKSEWSHLELELHIVEVGIEVRFSKKRSGVL